MTAAKGAGRKDVHTPARACVAAPSETEGGACDTKIVAPTRAARERAVVAERRLRPPHGCPVARGGGGGAPPPTTVEGGQTGTRGVERRGGQINRPRTCAIKCCMPPLPGSVWGGGRPPTRDDRRPPPPREAVGRLPTRRLPPPAATGRRLCGWQSTLQVRVGRKISPLVAPLKRNSKVV